MGLRRTRDNGGHAPDPYNAFLNATLNTHGPHITVTLMRTIAPMTWCKDGRCARRAPPMLRADRDPMADFMTERIQGARFFDLDAISDRGSPLPHMLPSEVCTSQNPSFDYALTHSPPACLTGAPPDMCMSRGSHKSSSAVDRDICMNTCTPYYVQAAFAAAADALGISNDTTVVVYDTQGVFSAPRVWWTFKAFGHQKCAANPSPKPTTQTPGQGFSIP